MVTLPPGTDDPVGAEGAFARTMAALTDLAAGPPRLAVAVSGGSDSMALCRLAADWTAGRGGQITALTVDHGLRRESAAESRQVGEWMRRAGIAHHVLPWTGPKPTSGIQEAARQERYRLLLDWCHQHRLPYLLLGHHRQDQAETVLHRLLRGSGIVGLAGMADTLEVEGVRLLRPLLAWSPELLRALLRGWGWAWLDDPSNDDRRFARAQLRRAAPSLAAFGVTADALLAMAGNASAARAALATAEAELLGSACRFHFAGFARLDRGALAEAPAEVAAGAVARLLAAVGGSLYQPSIVRVRTALAAVREGVPSVTLGRCQMIGRSSHVWLFRERRDLPAEQPLLPCGQQPWDGRFQIQCPREPSAGLRHLRIRPMSLADSRILAYGGSKPNIKLVPHLARTTLPVLCDDQGLAMAPLLKYYRPDITKMHGMMVQMAWKPRHGNAEPGCFTKCDNERII